MFDDALRPLSLEGDVTSREVQTLRRIFDILNPKLFTVFTENEILNIINSILVFLNFGQPNNRFNNLAFNSGPKPD